MKISLRPDSDLPIYQQIVDSLIASIDSGALEAGHRLPTVRDLADELEVSRGTVKHAYDRLENIGLIEMTQGRGTFVRARERQPGAMGGKERAMNAIDTLLDELNAMSFSMRDIRIFFDLKMREREERCAAVHIGAVDCSPEALSMISRQLSELPGVEIHLFLLDDALAHPQVINKNIDLAVTTDTHFHQLENKLPDDKKLMRMALSTSPATVRELAGLHEGKPAGIVCASKRFASVMCRGCREYSGLGREPDIFLFGSEQEITAFIRDKEVLLLPAQYHEFCGRAETEALESFAAKGGILIPYNYSIDKGSLLYVTEQVERLRRAAWN